MWPTILTARKPRSSCVLQLRVLCVEPGRLVGSLSNVRLRGISVVMVFAPYTLEMLSLVLGFELVEKAIVVFFLILSDSVLMFASPCSPLGHQVAHSELDAHADAGIRVQQLQHLGVLALDVFLQLFASYGQIVEQRVDNDRGALLRRHD
jgi:hypothetical protein